MNLLIAAGLIGAFLLGVIAHALYCLWTGRGIDELEDFSETIHD